MSGVERLIPNIAIKRSFGFKTLIVFVGALLLLISALIRQSFPLLWIIPFLAGALVEWLIVATVYVEMNEVESEIKDARQDIRKVLRDIRRIQKEVNHTKDDIAQTKRDVFSRVSDSEGSDGLASLEDRVSALEESISGDPTTPWASSPDKIEERVSKLERKVRSLDRDLGRGPF